MDPSTRFPSNSFGSLGKNPLTTWNVGRPITIHSWISSIYTKAMTKNLWVNSDVIWYISKHQFSESGFLKNDTFVPMNMQFLSQSIWVNYNSQTWILFGHFGQIDFPNPS